MAIVKVKLRVAHSRHDRRRARRDSSSVPRRISRSSRLSAQSPQTAGRRRSLFEFRDVKVSGTRAAFRIRRRRQQLSGFCRATFIFERWIIAVVRDRTCNISRRLKRHRRTQGIAGRYRRPLIIGRHGFITRAALREDESKTRTKSFCSTSLERRDICCALCQIVPLGLRETPPRVASNEKSAAPFEDAAHAMKAGCSPAS